MTSQFKEIKLNKIYLTRNFFWATFACQKTFQIKRRRNFLNGVCIRQQVTIFVIILLNASRIWQSFDKSLWQCHTTMSSIKYLLTSLPFSFHAFSLFFAQWKIASCVQMMAMKWNISAELFLQLLTLKINISSPRHYKKHIFSPFTLPFIRSWSFMPPLTTSLIPQIAWGSIKSFISYHQHIFSWLQIVHEILFNVEDKYMKKKSEK